MAREKYQPFDSKQLWGSVMYQVVGYHRPASLPDALRLLGSGDRVPLAGGVHLRHGGGADPVELVDLQAAGLDTLDLDAGVARVGATVQLQTLAEDDSLPRVIRDAARAEQPSTLRSSATIGGTIATAADDSLLLAALLAHDAEVRLESVRQGARVLPLDELLADGPRPGELILEVVVQTAGTGAIERTGRTPRDVPIVGVVGRRVERPDGDRMIVALCGVAARPVLLGVGGVASLEPFGDHRATAAYRLHLAEVLTARVLERLR